jgi:hypothetical protein
MTNRPRDAFSRSATTRPSRHLVPVEADQRRNRVVVVAFPASILLGEGPCAPWLKKSTHLNDYLGQTVLPRPSGARARGVRLQQCVWTGERSSRPRGHRLQQASIVAADAVGVKDDGFVLRAREQP